MSDETGPRGGVRNIRDALSVARETVDRDTPELYEFGPFRLDPAERKLLRGNEMVELTPKAFDTLVLLVRNSGRLLEKEKFMARSGPTVSSRRAACPTTSSSCEGPWAMTPHSLKQFPGEVTVSSAPCDSCHMPCPPRRKNRSTVTASRLATNVHGQDQSSRLVVAVPANARRLWRVVAVIAALALRCLPLACSCGGGARRACLTARNGCSLPSYPILSPSRRFRRMATCWHLFAVPPRFSDPARFMSNYFPMASRYS